MGSHRQKNFMAEMGRSVWKIRSSGKIGKLNRSGNLAKIDGLRKANGEHDRSFQAGCDSRFDS